MYMTVIWTIAVLVIIVLSLAIPLLIWKRKQNIRQLVEAGKYTFTLLWKQRGNMLEPGYYLFYGANFLGHFPTFEKLSRVLKNKRGYFIGRVPTDKGVASTVSGRYLALDRQGGANL